MTSHQEHLNKQLLSGKRLKKTLTQLDSNVSATTMKLLTYGDAQGVNSFREKEQEVREFYYRYLTNEERRSNARMEKLTKANTHALMNAGRPALLLEDQRALRLKLFGDVAAEVEKERKAERAEERAKRRAEEEEEMYDDE